MINEDILKDLNDLDSSEPSEEMISDLQQEGDQEIRISSQYQLLKNQAFLEHVGNISSIVDSKIEKGETNPRRDEVQLVERSNFYASSISKEINSIFRTAKSIYYKKFPELQSIVTKPALYCKAVSQIEQAQVSHQAKSSANRFAYLSNHQKMSLQLALSSAHQQLTPEQAIPLLEKTNTAVLLNEHYNLLMIYLESSIQLIAPNLCELVGSLTASKLISTAGGIKQLSLMSPCNIQLLGGRKSAQIGFSQAQNKHIGAVFSEMSLVKDTPIDFQMQLVRMLSCNTAKCARADILKSSKGLGARFRREMYERFEKIQQQRQSHPINKPLPVPDLQPKKKRGGKRYRKTKELYEMSEIQKQQNRLKFGEQAQQETQEGFGLGMLSQGTGKLKLQVKKQKLNVSKKMNQRMTKQSGLESSLNINAPQGIQLVNPDVHSRAGSGKETIFSKSAGFQTVLNNKFGSYK